ncbi:hypothetical protein EFB08_21870 [Rufibacter latericius]|uniref:Uncharacterized protein n=1 Tax=Rufibacter latericius TaxID=2487040 RepID=A0A3M9MB56_9BACT|nr:hypothetical protein EFB08_21870 [Rufibacter latericius]
MRVDTSGTLAPAKSMERSEIENRQLQTAIIVGPSHRLELCIYTNQKENNVVKELNCSSTTLFV